MTDEKELLRIFGSAFLIREACDKGEYKLAFSLADSIVDEVEREVARGYISLHRGVMTGRGQDELH